MSEIASAYVTLLPSFKGGQRSIEDELGPASDRAGRATGGRFGKVWASSTLAPMRAVGAAALGFFAADKAKDFLGGAIGAASDLNESTTKLQQVFGGATGQIMDFGAGGAKAFGQTKLAVLDAAATFGVYGKAAGLTGAANAKFSEQLVGLSTDLASFYNTDPSQAVEAIAAGLRGESEPLRQYGVLLDDATLRQQAFQMGLIKTTKNALTPQQKALAAQAVIMKQTKVAQGDFARTSGGLANQQRILAAQWGDAKAKIGGAFLPAVTGAVKLLNKGLFPAVSKAGTVVGGLYQLFAKGNFTGSFGKALGISEDSKVVDVLFRTRDAVKGVFASFSNGGGSGDFLGKFTAQLGGIATAAQNVAAVLLPIVQQIVGAFVAKWSEIGPKVSAIFETVKGLILAVLGLIQAEITAWVAIVSFIWQHFGQTILTFLTSAFSAMLSIVNGVLTVIRGVILTVTALIHGDWAGVWNGIKMILSGVWETIKGIVAFGLAALRALMAAAWTALKLGVSAAWAGIKALVSAGVSGIVSEIKALPGQIMALGGLMLRAGSSLMGKLFEGLKSAAGSAGGFAVDIAGAIVDNVKDFLNGVLPHSIGIHKGPINLDVPLFPMLAKGGPLGGGSPAIVGERGPELFVPDVPGRVMTATATRRILSAQQGTGAMPSTLVVVDADGALIGRMQVEANSVVQGQARSVALAGKR